MPPPSRSTRLRRPDASCGCLTASGCPRTWGVGAFPTKPPLDVRFEAPPLTHLAACVTSAHLGRIDVYAHRGVKVRANPPSISEDRTVQRSAREHRRGRGHEWPETTTPPPSVSFLHAPVDHTAAPVAGLRHTAPSQTIIRPSVVSK